MSERQPEFAAQAANIPIITETGAPEGIGDSVAELALRLGRIVERGAVEIGIEFREPGVAEMLSALHPGNPLVRPRDHDIPNRKWEYPTISESIGLNLDGPYDPLELAKVADKDERAVIAWREFLSRRTLSDVERADPQIDAGRDATQIAGQLRPVASTVLERFAEYQDRKLRPSIKSPTRRAHEIQAQQVMFPYALAQIAYEVFPGYSATKHIAFAREFGGSVSDAHAPQELIERIPFTSQEAANTYIAVMKTFQQLLAARTSERFTSRVVEQFVITAFGDRLTSGAFFTDPKQIAGDVGATTGRFAKELGYDLQMTLDIGKRLRGQLERHIATAGDWRTGMRTFIEANSKSRAASLVELSAVGLSQILTDGIGTGRIDVHGLRPLNTLINRKPLAEQAERVLEIQELFRDFEAEEVLLDFEVAPSHTGMHAGREISPRSGVRAPSDLERVTWSDDRVTVLKQFISLWGRGVLGRSKIPNLPAHRQYYIALLPDVLPNGDVIWHAIADNTQLKRHKVLFFRGESGVNKYGRTVRSWDRVLRWYKDEMRKGGVRGFNHTDTVYDRVLEYLLTDGKEIPGYEAYGEIALRENVEQEPEVA